MLQRFTVRAVEGQIDVVADPAGEWVGVDDALPLESNLVQARTDLGALRESFNELERGYNLLRTERDAAVSQTTALERELQIAVDRQELTRSTLTEQIRVLDEALRDVGHDLEAMTTQRNETQQDHDGLMRVVRDVFGTIEREFRAREPAPTRTDIIAKIVSLLTDLNHVP